MMPFGSNTFSRLSCIRFLQLNGCIQDKVSWSYLRHVPQKLNRHIFHSIKYVLVHDLAFCKEFIFGQVSRFQDIQVQVTVTDMTEPADFEVWVVFIHDRINFFNECRYVSDQYRDVILYGMNGAIDSEMSSRRRHKLCTCSRLWLITPSSTQPCSIQCSKISIALSIIGSNGASNSSNT